MDILVGDDIDGVSLSADFLPCLLVGRALHGGPDHLFPVYCRH